MYILKHRKGICFLLLKSNYQELVEAMSPRVLEWEWSLDMIGEFTSSAGYRVKFALACTRWICNFNICWCYWEFLCLNQRYFAFLALQPLIRLPFFCALYSFDSCFATTDSLNAQHSSLYSVHLFLALIPQDITEPTIFIVSTHLQTNGKHYQMLVLALRLDVDSEWQQQMGAFTFWAVLQVVSAPFHSQSCCLSSTIHTIYLRRSARIQCLHNILLWKRSYKRDWDRNRDLRHDLRRHPPVRFRRPWRRCNGRRKHTLHIDAAQVL